MSKVQDILNERGATHGDYDSIVRARGKMQDELIKMYQSRHNGNYPPTHILTMWGDIILKLVRSAANTKHQDNWDDLAGYATIIQIVMTDEINREK